MANSKLTPNRETAHVLFIDIVGYSIQPMEAQRRLVEELQELVRLTPEVGRAAAHDDSIRLPTGDGMAIVFFHDPVDPLRCAMALARSLRQRPHLELRMGLHTGPVYRVADINANANVSGGGIIFAQRVMDCGDAGHILLSSQIADQLRQVGAWPIHDLGNCEVKHGERLHLFNLYTEEIGNPRLPEKLRSAALTADRAATAAAAGLRVALLYKRNAEPDQHLLLLLEAALNAQGHRVFVDRHLQVGMEWAREIDQQVRASDAVIPLLSAAAVQSEMLAHEVQTAQEAAEAQHGRPRLLPVRVAFAGPLPEPLGAILDPLEYALWESPADDERLTAQILSSLRNPLKPAVAPEKLEAIGGAVPLDSTFYVVRQQDEEFRAAITRQDSIVLVKGARQMGKTSLLARGLQQARQQGARVVRGDLQKLNAAELETPDALFLKLARSIADQLALDVFPEDVWHARRGPSENFERFWRRECLGKIDAPIIWGLDEADRLFGCDFASEIFGLFRSWHNERALEPDGPWRRLTLAIAYATEAHLFIRDANQSPFNVGTRVSLGDFTREQVADLNGRYGSPLRDQEDLSRFTRLLGGHPYLVRRGLHEMITTGMDLARFEAQADEEDGIYGDHLRRILVLLARDPALCEVVRGVLHGEPCPDADSFYRLRSAGVMVGTSMTDVRPRCRLYESYLTRHLG
jgi:AAA domain-containing protein/TIR domain-containing protein